MKFRSIAGYATLAALGIGGTVANAQFYAAQASTRVLVSVRAHTVCSSSRETETVYYHKSHGVYVPYSPPKVEYTASENHGTVCHTATTKRYES